MIFSHTVILLFASIFLGFSAFLYFNWNYHEEIKKNNELLLTQKKINFTANITDRLTENSYTILSNYQGRTAVTKLFDTTLAPSDWKITQAYTFLNNIVLQNSQFLESISIYCPENRLFLSTVSGSNHMAPDDPSVQWMEGRMESLMASGQTLLFARPIDIYMAGDSSPRIMLYSPYPLSPQSGESSRKGLLCITIRNSYLENLLNDSTLASSNMTFLLSPEGSLLNRQSGFPEEILAEKRFQSLLSEQESFLYRFKGSDYVVSRQSADGSSSVLTGFTIVNVTLTDSFHKRSASFLWILTGICLAAIGIGLFIAFRFSKNLYRPLKETVTKISLDFPALSADNEYGAINDYISRLHQKASDSQGLLYHSLIRSLLTVPMEASEIEKQLFSAQTDFPHSSFLVCSVGFTSAQAQSALPLLQVMKELRMLSDSSISVHAVLLEEQQLGILANADNFSPDFPLQIQGLIREKCGMGGKVYYSSRFEFLEDTYRHYSSLLRMRRYEYFFPKQELYDMDVFRKKDLSASHLSTKLSALPAILRSRKTNEILSLLGNMRTEIESGNFSYESCNSQIIRLIYMLSEYIRESCLEKELPLEEVYDALASLPDIDVFTAEYLKTVEAAYQMLDSRSQNQNAFLFRQMQDYIWKHLKNDISLNEVAEQMSLAPTYVSKLFRECTGVSFVSFVKKCKMEKAKELLAQNDRNVDQVAMELGYNSTAYFIKLFKDTYGITPKVFQKQVP